MSMTSWTRALALRAIALTVAAWTGACVDEALVPPDCTKGDTVCQHSEQPAGSENPAGCICADIYKPVCGKDGKTYGNACEAACASTPVAQEGECQPALDAGASCICPAIFKPVCGEDGQTYGNACEAACGGVPVAHEGECKDGGAVSGSCRSNVDCANGGICYPPTHQCQPECSIACLVYDPVCGTDGKTYGCGAADAHCHGVEVAYPGECKAGSCACTKEYQPVCGVDGTTYGNRCMAGCAGVEIAHDGSCDACAKDEDCPHGSCDQGVTCAAIGCPPPPPSKCTVCGDGSALRCKVALLPCPVGQVREIVNGCYGACVDRHTCRAPQGACNYEGKSYQAGESFPSSDGCNSCSCSEDGLVACTLKACVCDYSAPDRKWVAKSAEQCKLVKFACAAGQRPFFNQCGCGCEAEPTTCRVGGCSGQLCVGPGEPDVSTCEWRDEYACYRTASCALQASGRCGWTQSDELRRCLEGAR